MAGTRRKRSGPRAARSRHEQTFQANRYRTGHEQPTDDYTTGRVIGFCVSGECNAQNGEDDGTDQQSDFSHEAFHVRV